MIPPSTTYEQEVEGGVLPAVFQERPIPTFHIEPVTLGPTWQIDPLWDGLDEFERYILPKWTLGYQVWDWVAENLLSPDGTDEDPKPFVPTPEQFRFVLWWYAVDENGEFVYRSGIFQRLKGHGKDPLVAVLAAVEFLGPCRFEGWATEDMPQFGYHDAAGTRPMVAAGDPVARDNPQAWVQVAAVSKTQTRNTMLLFPALFSTACKKRAGMTKANMGVNIITAYNNTRRIEAVTSNPRTLEGGRATFIIKNETHHWLATNNGHAMQEVIDRNAVKSKGGASRSLSITNAYEPSEDSTAQREREAWEDQQAGLAYDTGTLYDSLEAPKECGLLPPRKEGEPEPNENEVRAWLSAVVRAVRGDSKWLNIRRIVDAILNPANPTSTSRRFYFNQVVADEDAWVVPAAIEAAIDPIARAQRGRREEDNDRAGWIVNPDDPIVVFFDGSKSDDSTVLIGCRVSDGYCFVIGTWNRPTQKERAKTWLAPRQAVDERVQEMRRRFRIVAFFADPSHTVDDSGNRYWDSLIDKWHREMQADLLLWSIKTGANAHSIMWDMASPERTKQFVAAAEMTVSEMERKDQFGEYTPEFTIDPHPVLIKHLRNTRRSPGAFGVGMRKEGRESLKKIDAAVGLVGARMLRRLVLNSGAEEETQSPKTGWAYAV